ncbi:hypothetical protein CesoFtcFv8_019302, partial [Champsocephalus esox]
MNMSLSERGSTKPQQITHSAAVSTRHMAEESTRQPGRIGAPTNRLVLLWPQAVVLTLLLRNTLSRSQRVVSFEQKGFHSCCEFHRSGEGPRRDRLMANATFWTVVLVCVSATCTILFSSSIGGGLLSDVVPQRAFKPSYPKTKRLPPPSDVPPPGPCTCPTGALLLKDAFPAAEYKELMQRRHKELQQHKNRTESVLSTLLYAPSNSPLQYPIQGFKVRPMTPTIIPGLALHAAQRNNYTVSLKVSKGVLSTVTPAEGAKVQGNGESRLMVESSSLEVLNELLADVSYASTLYHIHTGDLASFQFEDHEAVFPITIKQPQPPVLYDMGTDINSQVTITTKTFLRYPEVNALLRSIRQFYKDMEVIIADDSFVTEKITGDHTQHFIMPPAQGWFAGRNLAVSQVTTKYFLWVDDDFQFTKGTNIEEMVKIMETNPELDV